jgi:glutaredoxin 3
MGQGFFKASYFHDLSTVEFTEEQKQAIEKQIATEPVMVYSKRYCPHCKATRRLLEEKGVESANIREINEEDDGLITQAILFQMTKQKTVPNVFIGGSHIGGNSDLQKLAASGELKALLDRHSIEHSCN